MLPSTQTAQWVRRNFVVVVYPVSQPKLQTDASPDQNAVSGVFYSEMERFELKEASARTQEQAETPNHNLGL
jgi:hypothetical protein